MQRLGDLFSMILNLIFVFTTVSYTASAFSGWVSELLRWRAKVLLDNLKALLDDPHFRGVARELYNNLLFNPLGDGHLRSEADLSDFSSLPIEVDPLVFGQAMIEILGFEEAAREELAKPLAEISLDTFATSATASLAGKRDTLALSDRFYDLALNTLQRNYNQVKATLGQPPAQPAQSIRDVLVGIIKETGNWYSSSQLLTTAKYRRRIRWVAFASGFGLAAVLDLQPVPIGGSAIAGKLPYAVALFEWVVVAASTLFGAPFWFEILKKLAPGIVGPGNAPQPNAGLAGEARDK